MSMEPLVSQQLKSPNKFLWAVKSYLDLLNRDEPLVAGSGLKKLYVLSSGIATLSDLDIEGIVAKSDRMRLIPGDLRGFLFQSVCRNLWLYGLETQKLIQDRIVDIANGDIRNPDPVLKFSADEARRYFYVPPFTIVRRIQKALNDDVGLDTGRGGRPIITKLQDVANETDFLLTRYQGDEGHVTPVQTSWGALNEVMVQLVSVLEQEMAYAHTDLDYRRRARACLKILWFIAKLLMGDLSVRPERKDVTMVDLERDLCLTDGTLAAIPFPLKETVKIFGDSGPKGVSPRGYQYLCAVAGASFYKSAISSRDID